MCVCVCVCVCVCDVSITIIFHGLALSDTFVLQHIILINIDIMKFYT